MLSPSARNDVESFGMDCLVGDEGNKALNLLKVNEVRSDGDGI